MVVGAKSEGLVSARPWEYTIESVDWDAAARELIETINGVGTFHYDSLQDAIDAGPFRDSREFVLEHLHWLKYWFAVYGEGTVKSAFHRRLR